MPSSAPAATLHCNATTSADRRGVPGASLSRRVFTKHTENFLNDHQSAVISNHEPPTETFPAMRHAYRQVLRETIGLQGLEWGELGSYQLPYLARGIYSAFAYESRCVVFFPNVFDGADTCAE